jgi:hypothetical protein
MEADKKDKSDEFSSLTIRVPEAQPVLAQHLDYYHHTSSCYFPRKDISDVLADRLIHQKMITNDVVL